MGRPPLFSSMSYQRARALVLEALASILEVQRGSARTVKTVQVVRKAYELLGFRGRQPHPLDLVVAATVIRGEVTEVAANGSRWRLAGVERRRHALAYRFERCCDGVGGGG